MAKPSSVTPDHVRKEIWEGALSDAKKGWLSGPFTDVQLREKLGPMYVVSRRFGLEQSDEMRAIDDMTESLVNAAYGSSYKLDLPGIDGISTMCRTWLESVGSDRSVLFRLSDGRILKGQLHESLSVEEATYLCGRTLDLDSAYKRLLTAKSSLWCSVLAVEDMDGDKQMFISNVIPFGSSSSVCSFNRFARAIFTIGVSFLAWFGETITMTTLKSTWLVLAVMRRSVQSVFLTCLAGMCP